jgi:hypothetical protein
MRDDEGWAHVLISDIAVRWVCSGFVVLLVTSYWQVID